METLVEMETLVDKFHAQCKEILNESILILDLVISKKEMDKEFEVNILKSSAKLEKTFIQITIQNSDTAISLREKLYLVKDNLSSALVLYNGAVSINKIRDLTSSLTSILSGLPPAGAPIN